MTSVFGIQEHDQNYTNGEVSAPDAEPVNMYPKSVGTSMNKPIAPLLPRISHINAFLLYYIGACCARWCLAEILGAVLIDSI